MTDVIRLPVNMYRKVGKVDIMPIGDCRRVTELCPQCGTDDAFSWFGVTLELIVLKSPTKRASHTSVLCSGPIQGHRARAFMPSVSTLACSIYCTKYSTRINFFWST